MPAKIIFGLGNPEERYAATRHNAGFQVADALHADGGWTPFERRREGRGTEAVEFRVAAGKDRYLVKPLTHMNRSGACVAQLLERYGAGPGDILVICDEIQLKLGEIRLGARGSAGGHNGLESVIRAIGTEDFARLRVGIGPSDSVRDLSTFVLSSFDAAEAPKAAQAVTRGAQAARAWLDGDINRAMNLYNRKETKEL